ncbi:MAG TPA: hypothetical protein VEH49_03985, partial [Methylomirabilota bacterium]|nr:hypothetical protein [Methylomirabilota bacterium]
TGNPLGNWIAPSSCPTPTTCTWAGLFANPATQTTLGNMGRNAIVGPGFSNTDLALFKNTKITERVSLQFRTDAFDLFNHPNYGNPSRVLSSLTLQSFGTIASTRFPTGDSGSSRQLQLSMKLLF